MFLVLQYLAVLLGAARQRARSARARADLGASTIEWAIIAAISVTMAVAVGGIIYNVVKDKGTALEKCGNASIGATNC